MYKLIFKHLFDLLISFVTLCLLSPIFILILILLLLTTKSNPFFLQRRIGKNERVFNVIKFKTMSDKTDSDGALLPDDQRLTFVGKILRKNSLDELPQLLNVLIGDMSIVGPRPLPILYIKLYNPQQKRRHSVKVGITGWAQINGRNTISWKKKFEYDCWYVDNISLYLDIKIIIITIMKVIKREGVLEEGTNQIESFNGNN